jgi:hypothetical protein
MWQQLVIPLEGEIVRRTGETDRWDLWSTHINVGTVTSRPEDCAYVFVAAEESTDGQKLITGWLPAVADRGCEISEDVCTGN